MKPIHQRNGIANITTGVTAFPTVNTNDLTNLGKRISGFTKKNLLLSTLFGKKDQAVIKDVKCYVKICGKEV